MGRPYLTAIYNENGDKWVKLPVPSRYDATTSTIVNAGRNAQGELIGNVVRSGFAKVEMTIPYLTKEQYSTFLKLFEPSDMYVLGDSDIRGSFINYVEYFDQVLGEYTVRQMYVSDRRAGMMQFRMVNGVPAPYGWKDVSIHLIDTGKKVEQPPSHGYWTIAENGTLEEEL